MYFQSTLVYAVVFRHGIHNLLKRVTCAALLTFEYYCTIIHYRSAFYCCALTAFLCQLHHAAEGGETDAILYLISYILSCCHGTLCSPIRGLSILAALRKSSLVHCQESAGTSFSGACMI
jgi:hypothetical protein